MFRWGSILRWVRWLDGLGGQVFRCVSIVRWVRWLGVLGGQVLGLVCMVRRVRRLVSQHHNVGQVVSMGQHGREGQVSLGG